MPGIGTRVRPALGALIGVSLLSCRGGPGQQRRATSQREFHLTGPAAIAMVKPQNGAGRLGAAELQFLEVFNEVADSLERAGYLVAVSFQDTVVIVPPSDSFDLSPSILAQQRYPAAYVFTPGRGPYVFGGGWTSRQELESLRGWQLSPRPAHRVTVRATPLPFRALSVGGGHTCGLTAQGTAFCWGVNDYGQLGDGTTADRTRPAAVAGGLRFAELTAGGSRTCGRTVAGEAFCWGLNAGQPWNKPVAIARGLRFVELSTGGAYTCGRTAAGQAYCRSDNVVRRTASGIKVGETTPVAVAGGLRFVQLSAGGAHVCGRTAAGRAYCWGANYNGQLGDGTKTDKATPVAVAGGLRFVALALGSLETCGRTADGRAFCWGANSYGQLGDSTRVDRTTPTPVVGGLRFVELSVGNIHTCGRTADGLGFCWGGTANGERGDGTFTNVVRTTPAPVAGGLRFVELRAGGDHTCGRTKEGAAFCWGWNGHGGLGDGGTIASLGPVQVVPQP
jgi:alpha-tubulin suppressor-like RCC1 family protein